MAILKEEYKYKVRGNHAIIETYDAKRDKNYYEIVRLSYRRMTLLYTFRTYEQADAVFRRM